MCSASAASSKTPVGSQRRISTFCGRFNAEATYFQPETVEELQAIVTRAREQGKTVKVIGAGHSFSNIALTDGYMVSLDHLNRLDEPVEREGGWTAKLQAGIRLKQLNRELWQKGFALSNMGEVAEQSIAGAMQTATHGTGTGGTTAAAVVAMTLLTADGKLMHLPQDDPKLFRAACVGLGAVGIVVDATLKVQPKFYIEETVTAPPFDQVLADMPGLIAENPRIRFRWMPHTNQIQVSILTPTDQKPARENLEPRAVSGLEIWFMNRFTGMGHAFPAFVPLSNRILGLTYLYRQEKVVDLSFRRFANGVGQLLKPHEEIEYAVSMSNAARSFAAVRKLIEDNGLRVNFAVELRFAPADNHYMSPSYQQDMAYIGGNTMQGRDAERYFRLFAQLIMDEFQGRPHLGKDLVGITPQYLRRVYGDGYVEFKRVLEQYDPDGLFANDFVRKMFPREL